MNRKDCLGYLSRLQSVKNSSSKIIWSKRILLLTFIISVLLLYYYSPYPTSISFQDSIVGFLVGILVFFINTFFSYFIFFIKKKKRLGVNGLKIPFSFILDSLLSSLFIKIFVIVLLACIEEYIFRSYLLSFFNGCFSIFVSVLLNAVLFYVIHANSKIFELMFMAVIFAIVTIYTDNIVPAVIAHGSNNILVYFMQKRWVKVEILNK